MSPALLVFLIPVAVWAIGMRWYGRLFKKSIGSYRARDFLASVAVLIGLSLATIFTFLFCRYLYLQMTGQA